MLDCRDLLVVYFVIMVPIPFFVKISNRRECSILPSIICADETPSLIAWMHVRALGSIPPFMMPSLIRSSNSLMLIFSIKLSGSLGSSRIPGTSVSIISFSAPTSAATSPATVSAFKFRVSAFLSIPMGEIMGMYPLLVSISNISGLTDSISPTSPRSIFCSCPVFSSLIICGAFSWRGAVGCPCRITLYPCLRGSISLILCWCLFYRLGPF